MSGLADKMVDQITGGRGAPGDLSFREAAELVWSRAGNQRAAARMAGVDRRTFQRWFANWRAGREPRPTPSTRAKLAEAVRRAQIDPAGLSESAVSLTVVERGGRQDGRTRVLTNTNLNLREGTMRRVAEVWVKTGDAEAAGAEFIKGIQTKFYRRYLAPPPAERDRGTGGGGSVGGGGGAADDGDDADVYDTDEGYGPGIDDGEGPADAWGEFYDDLYDEGDLPDEGYGGDVTG